MTERRRPPDNDAGQESLFGGEAFTAGPPAPTSWEREHASPARHRRETPPEESAHLPLGPEADIEPGSPPFDAELAASEATRAAASEVSDATPAAFESAFAAPVEDERAPIDESQYLTGYEGGPSVEDLAAYDFEVGAVPTEVPADDAGTELAELERATVPGAERRPRAPLAGPTLDDVMSRAWEGLVTGLPAACPVCDGELQSTRAGVVRGTCSSCGTTIE
jgi:hypothetical protein